MIEETEEPVKEYILRALPDVSARETENILYPIVWIHEFLIFDKGAVCRSILDEPVLERRALSCGLYNRECNPSPYEIFITKPTNTAGVRWRQFCIRRKIDGR